MSRSCMLAALAIQMGGVAVDREVRHEVEGTWELVSVIESGKSRDVEQRYSMVKIAGGELRTLHFGQSAYVAKYIIDTDSDPMRISWSWHDTKPHYVTGIFTTEGGVLTICLKPCGENDSDKLRPTAFESTEENGCRLYVFSRRH